MRRILVDRALQRAAVPHGGQLQLVGLTRVTLATEHTSENVRNVLMILDALESLASFRRNKLK